MLVSYIGEKIFLQKLSKNKNFRKVRDYCQYSGKYTGNSKLNKRNEFPAVFHNCSNYDYHFIIKGLEKHSRVKHFSIPIDKKSLKNFNSARFIFGTSLSNLLDYLTDRIHKVQCKDCACFLIMKVSRIV